MDWQEAPSFDQSLCEITTITHPGFMSAYPSNYSHPPLALYS